MKIIASILFCIGLFLTSFDNKEKYVISEEPTDNNRKANNYKQLGYILIGIAFFLSFIIFINEEWYRIQHIY